MVGIAILRETGLVKQGTFLVMLSGLFGDDHVRERLLLQSCTSELSLLIKSTNVMKYLSAKKYSSSYQIIPPFALALGIGPAVSSLV